MGNRVARRSSRGPTLESTLDSHIYALHFTISEYFKITVATHIDLE